MTNSIALILALIISGAVAAAVAYQPDILLFLARRFVDLIDYLAFWR